VRAGPDGVTFATSQYGERLARRNAWYEQLVSDLARHPFVVIGTRLDEAPLWQHAVARADELSPDVRPASWVIDPRLTLARRSLLARVVLAWLRCEWHELLGAAADQEHG